MSKVQTRIDLEALKKDLRKVVLTGVGAAVLAKEGAYDLAKKFLARGEDVAPEITKAFKKLAERRKAVTAKAEGLRTKAESTLKKFVQTLPLVTRRDVGELTKRIDALTEKVDALARKRK